MTIRIRYVKRGGHYHCRVFTGKGKGMTFTLCGELVFSEAEWDDVRDRLQSVCELVAFDLAIERAASFMDRIEDPRP